MKGWKKRLLDEFDECVPPLSKEVKSTPIAACEDGDFRQGALSDGGGERKKSRIKRLMPWIYSVCAVAAAVVVLIIALYQPAAAPPTPKPTPAPGYGGGVYSLEINPSCAFITDDDGKVTAVRALNSDADVILAKAELELVGTSLAEAVKKYADYAARLGYLDFESEKNAVRLCGSGDQAVLDSAASALTDYFMNKGAFVAVLKESKTVEALGEAFGIEQTDTLEGLSDKITAFASLYGERECENVTADRLQKIYSSAVLGGDLFEIVQGELLANVEKIVANANDLLGLVDCDLRIMNHDGNPTKDFLSGILGGNASMGGDYWTIKGNPVFSSGYTEEFGALMDEMERLLADYEEKYGTLFKNVSELKNAAAVYEQYAKDDFATLFGQMTAEDFLNNFGDLIKMLELIGEDVQTVKDLFSVPETVDEYLAKLTSVLSEKFDFRLQEHKSVYEKEREAIAPDDYQTFIDEIIGEYGSLEDFWNKK